MEGPCGVGRTRAGRQCECCALVVASRVATFSALPFANAMASSIRASASDSCLRPLSAICVTRAVHPILFVRERTSNRKRRGRVRRGASPLEKMG